MFARFSVLLLALAVIVSACEKNGGRPAPNSVAAPQVPAAQNPQASPAETTPPVPHNEPKTPTTGKPTNPGGKVPHTTGKSRPIFLDNEGEIEQRTIKGKTFLMSNFDPKAMPNEVAVQSDKFVKGNSLTYLSDESYIACADPRCLNRIASIEDYRHHAETCWLKTLATALISRLEFRFDEDGFLKFIATIEENGQGQVIYGATNIGYNFDGSRLQIQEFTATTEGGRAIRVAGYTTGSEVDNGKLQLRTAKTYGKDGFILKVTPEISFGTIKNGAFAPDQSGRVYVGGSVISCLTPTTNENFHLYKQ